MVEAAEKFPRENRFEFRGLDEANSPDAAYGYSPPPDERDSMNIYGNFPSVRMRRMRRDDF